MTPPPAPAIETFTSDVLSVEAEGHVATLWLDREEKRNAMGPAFWSDLPRAMDAIGSDPEIRAVVVAARGPHFSVGLDLVAMAGLAGPSAPPDGGAARRWPRGPRSARAEILRLQASVTSVAECHLPVIAAIQGYCIGGGVDLIAACDIRLASGDAVFSVREAKVAIVADLGSLQRLPGIIGKGHVAELAYTGKDITADRAPAIGLVNQVERRCRRRLADARAMAAEIAANSPLAVGHQGGAGAGEGSSVAEGLEYVATWNAGFPGLRRPGRGHDRLHGEAAGRLHRAAETAAGRAHAAAPSARRATNDPACAPRARPPRAPRPARRARPR